MRRPRFVDSLDGGCPSRSIAEVMSGQRRGFTAVVWCCRESLPEPFVMLEYDVLGVGHGSRRS